METNELIKLLLPVLILQFGLVAYALVDLAKNGVRNLNKIAWILIILFVNILGAIVYLIFGRGDGSDVEDY